MITKEEYEKYFGVEAPSNLKRLEFLALNEIRTIMIDNVPKENNFKYEPFKKALIEQINYLNMNGDLIDSAGGNNYSLGSYSESSSSNNNSFNNKNRISPATYDILLSYGLLYCGIGGV